MSGITPITRFIVFPKYQHNLMANGMNLTYNKMNSLVKEMHLPSVFKNESIEITPSTNKQSAQLIDRLVKMGAKFIMDII